jgi:hypothetical protein
MADLPPEIDVAKAAEAAADAIKAAGLASDTAAAEVADNIQKDTATDRASTINFTKSFANGDSVSGTITTDSETLVKAAQDLVDSLKPILEVFSKDPVNIDVKGGIDQLQNDTNKSWFQKTIDYFKEKFNIKSDADLQKLAKDAEAKAAKEPNPTTREKLLRQAKIFGGLTLVGLTIAGVIELFKHLANEKSGCYQLHLGSGDEDIKLDCGTFAIDETNCNCDATSFTVLTTNCGVDKADTCANNYKYIYRHYSAWDIFCDFVKTVADDAQKSFDFLANIGQFFTKYGIWIFLGLLILIVVPLIFSLIKR